MLKHWPRGQHALQTSQDRGFREIKEALIARDTAPPKVGVGLLLSAITAVALGIAAFWAVVQLLFTPIKEDLDELKEEISGLNVQSRLSTLEASHHALDVDVQEHHAAGDHPFGVLSQVTELRGALRRLEGQVDQIDSEGSRVWSTRRKVEESAP